MLEERLSRSLHSSPLHRHRGSPQWRVTCTGGAMCADAGSFGCRWVYRPPFSSALSARRTVAGHWYRQSSRAALTALVVMALAAGCGGGDDDGGSATTPTKPSSRAPTVVSSTTLSPKEELEAEVRRGYEHVVSVTRALLEDPDENDPRIDQIYAGEVKDKARQQAKALRERGLVGRRRPGDDPTASRAEAVRLDGPTRAVVRECYVNGGLTVVASTGEVVDDDITTYQNDLTFVKQGGRWLMAAVRRLHEWKGVTGCAEDF